MTILRQIGNKVNVIQFLGGQTTIGDVWDELHMGQIPQDGENGQNVAFFIFLKLYCDQTVSFFLTFLNYSEGILIVTF